MVQLLVFRIQAPFLSPLLFEFCVHMAHLANDAYDPSKVDKVARHFKLDFVATWKRRGRMKVDRIKVDSKIMTA